MSNEIIEAAAFYIDVCLEHSRRFPLRNILVVASGFRDAEDEDRFVAAVEDIVDRYRLGESFDGLDDALRTLFLRLR